MSHSDKAHALAMLKARAQTIKEACAKAKLDPDQLTAAALVYQAMKILRMPADQIVDHSLVGSIQTILQALDQKAAAVAAYDPTDPDATVTLTSAQLMTLINSKIANA